MSPFRFHVQTLGLLLSLLLLLATLRVGSQSDDAAFVNVNVVPMDHERVLAGQTVWIGGGRIKVMSAVREIALPQRLEKVDAFVLASVGLSSQTARSTPEGLVLLHQLQAALGGAKRIQAVRDFEETIRAEAWDAGGNPLGEVRKRTRWMRSPNIIRLDQRGPRGTYVLYFDGASDSGWEILPDLRGPDPFKTTGTAIALSGGELQFARGYLSGFELNLWLADQGTRYRVTSSAPHVLRIEHGTEATEFTLDPATSLPLKSAGVSLAEPDRPVPAEMRYEEWREISGVRFPTRRVNLHSGVRRGEVTTEDIRVNVGLRPQDFASKPADFAPDIPIDRSLLACEESGRGLAGGHSGIRIIAIGDDTVFPARFGDRDPVLSRKAARNSR